MADADFGYVGGAPGKINLYVGKECVQYNVPSDEALNVLSNSFDLAGNGSIRLPEPMERRNMPRLLWPHARARKEGA